MQHGISVSLSTIQRSLSALGYSKKKVHPFIATLVSLISSFSQLSKIAAERCEDARDRFLLEISKESPEQLVFVDETSVNILTTYRAMGRAPKGKRATMRSFFQRGNRSHVLFIIMVSTHPQLSGILFFLLSLWKASSR